MIVGWVGYLHNVIRHDVNLTKVNKTIQGIYRIIKGEDMNLISIMVNDVKAKYFSWATQFFVISQVLKGEN